MVTIVPDKLTTYQNHQNRFIPAKKTFNITEFLANSGSENPNPAQSFINARNQTTVLYLPNDIHLSTNGFTFIGKLLAPFFQINHAQLQKISFLCLYFQHLPDPITPK